jgi:ADP-ribose pyrophosphatase YjhB (NUDIX family)
MTNRPKVGIGVIIQNSEITILVCKRMGSYAPLFSIPGGYP